MINIEILKEINGRFWEIIGPVCASRIVAKENGEHFYVDPGDTWFAAWIGNNLAGVACLRTEGTNRGRLVHAWVQPEFRKQGVHRELIKHRMLVANECGMQRLSTVATPEAVSNYEAQGFVVVSLRGRYSRMVLEIKAGD